MEAHAPCPISSPVTSRPYNRIRVPRSPFFFSSRRRHTRCSRYWSSDVCSSDLSRLQFDEPRRKLGHAHPFIGEDGCGVYLPEDYFHLRPESGNFRSRPTSTLRLGRFTCIPLAEPLPAASDALESLSQETGVPVVTLRSLSVRELVQNTGLRPREAELARQRDFDELFFFAGASPAQIERFLADGRKQGIDLR